MPRYEGRWGAAGLAPDRGVSGLARARYYLWAWENPQPGPRSSIRRRSSPPDRKFLVAAITLGHAGRGAVLPHRPRER